jgi:hypothetical protein
MNIIRGKAYDGDGDYAYGDVGTIISGNDGVVHLGQGDVHITVISGDVGTFIAGDNPSGVSRSFGGKKR